MHIFSPGDLVSMGSGSAHGKGAGVPHKQFSGDGEARWPVSHGVWSLAFL